MPNYMTWSGLSPEKQSELEKIYRDNGITDIAKMQEHYNQIYQSQVPNSAFEALIQKINGTSPALPSSNLTHYNVDNPTAFTEKQLANASSGMERLMNNGITPQGAAAILGNAMQESSLNPKAVQKGGDYAKGYFQMHGDRLKDFYKFTKGDKSLKADQQLDYITSMINGLATDFYIKEHDRIKKEIESFNKSYLDTKDPKLRKKFLKQIKSHKDYYNKIYGKREEEGRLYPLADLQVPFKNQDEDIETLTSLFTNTVERSGKPEYDKKINYAKQIYNRYADKERNKDFAVRDIINSEFPLDESIKTLEDIYLNDNVPSAYIQPGSKK